ncbi:MAG TPA: ABC transporter permease [Actinomycetota bacterium]|nr:ABC transporter permease [Actinomycetota bacterium]
MGRYIVRRLVYMVVVLAVITLLTFFIFYVMPPTDPALAFAGKQPTAETLAEVRRQFGLDQPLYVQYGLFVKRLVLGDQYGWPGFGFSYQSRSSIRGVIFDRMGVTFQLAIGGAIAWLLIGIPIGVVSALKRRTRIDRAAMGFALFGVSAPVFWLGLMSLFIFWQKLGFSALGTGYTPFTESPGRWLGHMILPWLVVAMLYAAFYARLVRGNMIEVMNEDYIRTARAKGLSERDVIMKHGLRASLTPVVTLLGLDLGSLVGGAVVTESVFNLPGLGPYTISAVFRGDLPVVLAVTVFAAFAITFLSLIVDIAYAYLDPRVRYA